MANTTKNLASRAVLAAAILGPLTIMAGCQIEYAGQTLPSPYYLSDDIQYYAPGPEFKLAREAAALQEQSEAVRSEAQQGTAF